MSTAIGKSISFACLLAVGCLYGCGISQRLSGRYEGFRKVSVQPGTSEAVAHQLATVDLEIKPDGSALLSDAGMGVDGHIEYGASSATFVPDSIEGQSIKHASPDMVKRYTLELRPLANGEWEYPGKIVLKPQKTS